MIVPRTSSLTFAISSRLFIAAASRFSASSRAARSLASSASRACSFFCSSVSCFCLLASSRCCRSSSALVFSSESSVLPSLARDRLATTSSRSLYSRSASALTRAAAAALPRAIASSALRCAMYASVRAVGELSSSSNSRSARSSAWRASSSLSGTSSLACPSDASAYAARAWTSSFDGAVAPHPTSPTARSGAASALVTLVNLDMSLHLPLELLDPAHRRLRLGARLGLVGQGDRELGVRLGPLEDERGVLVLLLDDQRLGVLDVIASHLEVEGRLGRVLRPGLLGAADLGLGSGELMGRRRRRAAARRTRHRRDHRERR